MIEARPAGLRMEVTARISRDGGEMQEIPVSDDSVLRTGDGLQFRLRVARDAYVYVIAYGSSGSAVLLHPFSGRDEDAFLRAGEERIIPGPDRFLPLDRRAGEESFYAFASQTPVRFMSSLLVRVEARGDNRAAVAEMLRTSHPETLALNFRHVAARSTAGPAPEASPGAPKTLNDAVAGSVPRAPGIQEVEEPGVLSGEGSRIEAFISRSTTRNQGTGDRPAPATSVAPEVPSPPPATEKPEPAPAAAPGGWFSRLFGFERGESAPTEAEPPVREVAPATTYALPGPTEAKTDPVSVTADAQGAVIAPQESAISTPVEAGTGADLPSAEPPPAVAGNADPQLNVSVLDAIVASLGEMPERGRGREAALADGAATPGSETLASATEAKPAKVQSAAPAHGPGTETRESGSRVPGTPPASRTVVIGPSTAPSPELSAQIDSAAITGQEAGPEAAAGTSTSAPGPERGGSGILGGLASLFGGTSTSTQDTGADEAPSTAPAAGEVAKAGDLADGSKPQPDASAPDTEKVPAEAAASPPTGGFLRGLTGWFSPSPTDAGPQENDPESGEEKRSSPVVAARPPPAEAAAAAPEAAGRRGIFGGLSRLFGGDAGESSKSDQQESDQQVPRADVTPQAEITPESEEPAFKTVTRADGKQVVIVPGPPGRPEAPPASSDVLAREGSKIRALLEPEKPAVPEDIAVAEVRRQGPATAGASPDPVTPPRTPSPGEEATVAQTSVEPAVTSSAAVAGPSPGVNVSAPEPARTGAVAVVPDEVQAALEAGAGAAQPRAETLAALTAPPPAREVSVAPVREIDVTASDNVSSSIVLVVTPTGTGSGVLLDDTGHVLANWHLINGYSTVSVSFKSPNIGMPSTERTFSARVVRLNKTADLALLRIDSPPGDVLPVRFADADGIKSGDVLHAIGHPASGAWTHTLGKIDDVKPESSWYAGRNLLHRGTVIQAKVLDDPGSAGAPLFNNRMEFVGISTVGRSKRGVLTGVSVETIRLFLEAPPAGG
ncbi:MAG TPA: trypsin-like peptidase domain-containing protein [Gammaproteobacteria bacterium]